MDGAPVFKNYLYKEMEKIYGGKWDCEPDPIKHAHKMIAHIDKKRKNLASTRPVTGCSWIWPTDRNLRQRLNR